MLRIGYRTPLGLTIRTAARVIRELPPSLSAYRVRFSPAPPRLGAYYRAGYGLNAKSPLVLALRVAARSREGENQS